MWYCVQHCCIQCAQIGKLVGIVNQCLSESNQVFTRPIVCISLYVVWINLCVGNLVDQVKWARLTGTFELQPLCIVDTCGGFIYLLTIMVHGTHADKI